MAALVPSSSMQYGHARSRSCTCTHTDTHTRTLTAAQAPLEHEPLYCFCQRPSHGLMVCCGNDECQYEWFHFECVGITEAPSQDEEWFCPECEAKMKAKREGGGGGGGGRGTVSSWVGSRCARSVWLVCSVWEGGMPWWQAYVGGDCGHIMPVVSVSMCVCRCLHVGMEGGAAQDQRPHACMPTSKLDTVLVLGNKVQHHACTPVRTIILFPSAVWISCVAFMELWRSMIA